MEVQKPGELEDVFVNIALHFFIDRGSNLRLIIDHRSINSFEGVPNRGLLLASARPVPLGEPGIVAKGTETHAAL